MTQEAPPTKARSVTGDDLYRRSSQYRLWSYTPESLAERKRHTHERGVRKVNDKFDEAHKRLCEQHPQAFADHGPQLSRDALVEYFTLQEETSYLTYYCMMILRLSDSLKMPSQVKATAVSFFRKFYLENSVMEFHPRNVLFTCVFLAAKSENCFMKLEAFVNAARKSNSKLTEKDISDLEFTVLSSLKFTLLVHHPFRPLYGFFLDFQQVLIQAANPPVLTVDRLGALYDRAKRWLSDQALLTDVQFLFTPPQIALAALYSVDPAMVETYINKKFPTPTETKVEATPETKAETKAETNGETNGETEEAEEPAPPTPQQLLEVVKQCAQLGSAVPEEDKEAIREIDKKGFFCLHPTRLIEKRLKKLNPTPPPPPQ
ncbi:hypothetical protein DIURU_001749 [Diutina rugosa]|uniref:Cyclin-like domain-containing protein n=1 Tax=Diutina rugosa TaxID=5481 RepID=A0A642UT06_DIURU|nr:uncharacterized protein DIURU_001749 [Diutina rugosa]KAA8904913.1 hypothetical protein DIURU_001749 [Diutina rugosa]